ncbi:MAG: dTDP-glucose 4,6-dehydratase [Nanoarchaeota archaeon]|nr:dTDP-glucose 4,6-dehydratase [Nanoarchaeota archaeon]
MIFKNILVTGGTGFIGSNFILYMLKKYGNKINIINYDKLTYAANLKNLKEVENLKNYFFVKADICNNKKVENVVEKYNIDTIVHFAAESHVDNSILNPNIFVKTNIEGTQVLLDVVKNSKTKIRFHHISTDEVFGSLDKKDPKFSEKTPYNPKSPYSASKAGSDFIVRAYINTYNILATISNCSNNYGPRQHEEKLVPKTIIKCFKNEAIPIYGNGENIRDWLYVEDHCRAIDIILKKGKIGETYCIGGDDEKTNIDIVNSIINQIEFTKSKIKLIKDRKGHDFRYAINFKKIEKDLGWKPKVSFNEGLKKTISWYKIR